MSPLNDGRSKRISALVIREQSCGHSRRRIEGGGQMAPEKKKRGYAF